MWYFAVFLASFIVDLIPVVAPPAWVLMVFFMLRFHLNPWLVLVIGVAGSTLGRFIFSLYVPKIADRLIKRQKREEMEYLGKKLSQSLWQSWLFVFLYTLTPLSSSALFTAAAVAKVKALRTVPPFFFGKFLSDALMVFTGNYALQNLTGSLFSVKNIIIMVLGVVIVAGFLFLDWRTLLEEKRLRFNFKIWK